MEIFYTVTMQTKMGKKLYLSMWDGHPKWTLILTKPATGTPKRWQRSFQRNGSKTSQDGQLKKLKST